MRMRALFASVAATLLVLSGTPASRSEIEQKGQNYFVAGVRSDEFSYAAAPEQEGHQRQRNWCWAACIQMVLNYHGLRVTQEQVVARVYGELVDQPAVPDQIFAALKGWAPDNRGRFSEIVASPYFYQRSELVGDLAYKWPLIVGLANPDGGTGHAYVLTAVYYSTDQFNQPIFDKVVLRDPWPESPSRTEMSWDEFMARKTFMARVYVRRM